MYFYNLLKGYGGLAICFFSCFFQDFFCFQEIEKNVPP